MPPTLRGAGAAKQGRGVPLRATSPSSSATSPAQQGRPRVRDVGLLRAGPEPLLMGADNARGAARVELSSPARVLPANQALEAALARAVVAEALVKRKDAQIDRMIVELEEATANSMMQQQAIQAEHEVEVQRNKLLLAQERGRLAELAAELERLQMHVKCVEGERTEEKRIWVEDLAESIKQLEECLGELEASKMELERMRAAGEARETESDDALCEKQALAEQLELAEQLQQRHAQEGQERQHRIADEIERVEHAVLQLSSACSSLAARPRALPAPLMPSSGGPQSASRCGENQGGGADVVGADASRALVALSASPVSPSSLDDRAAADEVVRLSEISTERDSERWEGESPQVLQLRDALRLTRDRLEEALERCGETQQVRASVPAVPKLR